MYLKDIFAIKHLVSSISDLKVAKEEERLETTEEVWRGSDLMQTPMHTKSSKTVVLNESSTTNYFLNAAFQLAFTDHTPS